MYKGNVLGFMQMHSFIHLDFLCVRGFLDLSVHDVSVGNPCKSFVQEAPVLFIGCLGHSSQLTSGVRSKGLTTHGIETMTRGKKVEQIEEPDDGEPGTPADQQGTAAASSPDKLEKLTSLVKSLVCSQTSRDQQMEKESARQDQRWRSMQHQFLQIQAQGKDIIDESENRDECQHHNNDDDDETDGGDPGVMNSQASQQNQPQPPPSPPPVRAPHVHRESKLIPLSPDDDTEHYLATFERMATVCRRPKEEWAIQLILLLTGKEHSAYFLMDISDAEDYEKVKEVNLAKYEIIANTN